MNLHVMKLTLTFVIWLIFTMCNDKQFCELGPASSEEVRSIHKMLFKKDSDVI